MQQTFYKKAYSFDSFYRTLCTTHRSHQCDCDEDVYDTTRPLLFSPFVSTTGHTKAAVTENESNVVNGPIDCISLAPICKQAHSKIRTKHGHLGNGLRVTAQVVL